MPELITAIVVTICMLSGLILRYLPFRSVVPPRRKKLLFWIYFAACLINIAVATVIFKHFGLDSLLQYLHTGVSLFSVLVSLFNIFLIPNRLGEHLFVLGTVRTIHFLMLSVPDYVVHLLSPTNGLLKLTIFLGIDFVMVWSVHWLLKRLICKTIEPFLQMDPHTYSDTILYIPLAYFTAISTYISATDTTNHLMQLISSSISCAMFILMCWSMSADHKRMHKQQVMQKQLEAQGMHYMELKVRVEEARRMNHDFKHHLAVIHRYIETDDKKSLTGYIDHLDIQNRSVSQIPYTGNGAADGVLYHYMQQANQAGIDFKHVGVIQSNGIADVDLCALLGNALDNAVTACLTIETGRSISVISQSEKQMLSIMIRNSFDGLVKQNKAGILSRKRDNAPGLGLSSMRAICESYGGSLDVQWDHESFTVMFMLPLTE